jgi:hypothetical protein
MDPFESMGTDIVPLLFTTPNVNQNSWMQFNFSRTMKWLMIFLTHSNLINQILIILKNHRRSHFPKCIVKLRIEPIATDTVFSDTPTAASGYTAAQLFAGLKRTKRYSTPLKIR